jgi:hypothetical protein
MSKRRLTTRHSQTTPPAPRRLAWWVVAPSALVVGGLLTALAFIGCEAKSQDEAEPGGVCALFVERKNAGDPKADDLLGPAPAVPDHPVSRADADRLETDFFLRQDFTIDHVRHGKSTGQLVLVAKGNVAAPRLEIQDGASLDSEQRTMSNPDLTVEVRGGRIVGVEARLHVGK